MTTPTDPPEFTTTGNPTGPDNAPPETKNILRGLPGGRRTPPKDSPPKAGKRSTPQTNSKAAKSSGAPVPEGAIAAGIAGMYGQIGMFWGMFDPQCGSLLTQNALAMGNSLEAASKESPAVQEFLEKLIATSVWSQVIAAHLPVMAGIAMHHVPAIRKRFNPGTPDGADTQAPANVHTGTAG